MPEPTAPTSPAARARVADRAVSADAADASDEAFLECARADAAAAAMRKHKLRKQRSARRVAASATLLAIDEAASVDPRAPTARVTTITSVATLARRDAPPGALQRVMAHAAPNAPRTRAPDPRLELRARLRPAGGETPAIRAPAPLDSISNTRDGVIGVSATLLRDDVSLFGLQDGRVIVRGPDLDVDHDSRAAVVHPPDGWRGCAGGVRLLAELPDDNADADDADNRTVTATSIADTNATATCGNRTRDLTRRVFVAYDNGSWARLRSDARGEWRVSSSSPGPHPDFADPARLVPLRERSRRARRPPRVGAVRLASDGAALYLSSPVVGEHCIYRWDLPPESESASERESESSLKEATWGTARRLELHTDAVRCLAELPGSARTGVGLVSGGDDCVVAAWRPRLDPNTSRIIDMTCVNRTRSPAATRALAVSSDGRRLFTAGADRNVRAWDTSDVDGRGFVLLRAFLGGHVGFVASLAILDPNNPTHVVSGGEGNPGGFWCKGDGSVKVWRASDGKCLQTINPRDGDGDVVSLETRTRTRTRTRMGTTSASASDSRGTVPVRVSVGGDDEGGVDAKVTVLVAASSDGTAAEFEVVSEDAASETPRDDRGAGFTWNAGFLEGAQTNAKNASTTTKTSARRKSFASTGR
jgi:WD40 repeat protein